MAQTCPVRTPEERAAAEILDRAQRAMIAKVQTAVAEAAAQVREQMLAAGLDMTPPAEAYFVAVVHYQMYLTLCGADPDDPSGGNIEVADRIIRNQRSIADKYWGTSRGAEPKP